MSTPGEKIFYMMIERGMTKAELCEKAEIGKMSLERYITDYSLPDDESLKRIANVLSVSVDYIVGKSDVKEMAEPITKIPVFSEFPNKVTGKEDIRAMKAIDHITGNYSRSDMELCYFVIAKDDSMIYAKIGAGDKVLINPSVPLESGSLAAVRIEGEEAKIRRVFLDGDKVTIREESTFPKSEVYDISEGKVTFLGTVVFIISYPV
ncbi:MAG: S24 family peptidase [Clostridia bacterium]|nr:S24 family peptidase [Clostridia bacterium]